MTDYGAMIDEARAHIEHIAIGVPASQADRVRRGENDDPRTSMLVRLADAVEALVAENERLDSENAKGGAIVQRAADIALRTPFSLQQATESLTWTTDVWQRFKKAETDRDAALKALGESRARFGSLEASIVELGEAILKDSHCSYLGHDVLALVKYADEIHAQAWADNQTERSPKPPIECSTPNSETTSSQPFTGLTSETASSPSTEPGEAIRGASITYAEIDGIPVCIVDGDWCERELDHDGPHVFAPTAEETPE